MTKYRIRSNGSFFQVQYKPDWTFGWITYSYMDERPSGEIVWSKYYRTLEDAQKGLEWVKAARAVNEAEWRTVE